MAPRKCRQNNSLLEHLRLLFCDDNTFCHFDRPVFKWSNSINLLVFQIFPKLEIPNPAWSDDGSAMLNDTMQHACSSLVFFLHLLVFFPLLFLFASCSAVCVTVSPRSCVLPEQWKLIGSAPAAPVAGSNLKSLDRSTATKCSQSWMNLSRPKVPPPPELLAQASRNSFALQHDWLYLGLSILFNFF